MAITRRKNVRYWYKEALANYPTMNRFRVFTVALGLMNVPPPPNKYIKFGDWAKNAGREFK